MKIAVALIALALALAACNGDSALGKLKQEIDISREELGQVAKPGAVYKAARERARVEITAENVHARLAEIERAIGRSKDSSR